MPIKSDLPESTSQLSACRKSIFPPAIFPPAIFPPAPPFLALFSPAITLAIFSAGFTLPLLLLATTNLYAEEAPKVAETQQQDIIKTPGNKPPTSTTPLISKPAEVAPKPSSGEIITKPSDKQTADGEILTAPKGQPAAVPTSEVITGPKGNSGNPSDTITAPTAPSEKNQ